MISLKKLKTLWAIRDRGFKYVKNYNNLPSEIKYDFKEYLDLNRENIDGVYYNYRNELLVIVKAPIVLFRYVVLSGRKFKPVVKATAFKDDFLL